ncbi:MAG TPA: phosphate acyltransferase PlsX [Longimicrobiaceae bacterium]
MRIALDAMGSDRAPTIEVEGAIGALRTLGGTFRLVLVGDRDRIEAELAQHPDAPLDRIDIVHAPQRIEMGESPAQAIRRKPDSSIVVGLSLQKQGEVDAFISAGSTGAVMAGSLVILRPLPGVDRPAIGTVIPTRTGHTLLIDAGANVDTRPSNLVQFAHLGAIYARDLMGLENPRVGLLNIGEEPEKGDERALEAYRLLQASPALNFVGNIEGRDIIEEKCDVLVCDGFAGNVLLKFYESVAAFIVGLVRSEAENAKTGIDLSRISQFLDYTEYGGAPLLGVNGVSIICHGGSPPRAIVAAIRVAVQAVESHMVKHIQNRLARLSEAQSES